MSSYIDQYGKANVPKIALHAFLALVAVVLLFGTVGTVSAGQIGVKTTFSKVVGTVQPGIYFKLPFVQHVIKMDVQTQKEEVEGVEAASQDLQVVKSNVAVNYHLDAATAATMYQNVGVDYASRVIDPAIQESVKAGTAKYTAEQLITERENVRTDIIDLLASKMKQFGINIDAVSITNFDFSAQFNQAIEAKVTAEQNALAAKNKLDQVKYEAEQTIATAQAQAEAIKIQAQAINSQGGADYVELQRIKTWDGHACTSYCGLSASTGLLVTGK